MDEDTVVDASEVSLEGKLLRVVQSVYGFTTLGQHIKFRYNDLLLVLEAQHPKADSKEFQYRLLTSTGTEAWFNIKASSLAEADDVAMVFFTVVNLPHN